MKRYAWLALVTLLGCGINNESAKDAQAFTVVRTGSDNVVVRIDADPIKGPITARCYAIHIEWQWPNDYVATTAALPKGACQ